jgi:hypothetical protein
MFTCSVLTQKYMSCTVLQLPCRFEQPLLQGAAPTAACLNQSRVLFLLPLALLLPLTTTGSLPDNWGVLTSSAILDLSYNKLSGAVPAAWALAKQVSLANNTGLTGCAPAAWSLPGRQVVINGTGIRGTCP